MQSSDAGESRQQSLNKEKVTDKNMVIVQARDILHVQASDAHDNRAEHTHTAGWT